VRQSRKELLQDLIAEAREFRFCGPSDDPDEITNVTSGYMYLVVQLKRLAGPLLPYAAARRLADINVTIDDLYSAYEAKAEIDALLPDIEDAAEYADEVAEAARLDVREKAKVEVFSEAAVRGISGVLGDTQYGLTGREIGDILARCSIADPNPSASKRDRLHEALTSSQRRYGCGNHVVRFILEAMAPVSYAATGSSLFEYRRSRLNNVLAFEGLQLLEEGKLVKVERATTLSDVEPVEEPAEAAKGVHAEPGGRVAPVTQLSFFYVERMSNSHVQQGVTAPDRRDSAEDADSTPGFAADMTHDVGAAAPLTDEQAADYEHYEYKCRDRLGFPGTTPTGRSNRVILNARELAVGESSYLLLLRLAVELKKAGGGWVNVRDLESEGFAVSAVDHRAWGRLRKELRGFALDSDPKQLIENNKEGGYRISTHPDFVTYDRKRLLEHPSHRVKELAKKLP